MGVGGGGKGRGVGAGVKEGLQEVGPAVTGLARTGGGGKVLRCAALIIRARACFLLSPPSACSPPTFSDSDFSGMRLMSF